jgi:alanyl-tRNA synthetase
MPTDRLYYTDAYLTRFRATVVASADDGRRAYLDRSAFYPTSGGQPHDLGTLAGIPLTDVVDEGEQVAHLLAAPLGETSVEGEVDWTRRFDLMQQHTAQHLLSAVFEDQFGWATVSVHFGDTSSTLDLATGSLTGAQAEETEARANALITENRPVEVSFEDAASATGLRKATQRAGTLRIVTIAGLDRSACGGTHVRATGEIGALLLRKVERTKGQVRVEFLAGGRAIRRARTDAELLGTLAAGFSAAPEELPALVEGRQEQLQAAQAASRALAEQLAGFQVRAAYDAAPPGAGGARWFRMAVGEEQGRDALRPLGQAATALPGAVLLATLNNPPTVLLASAADSGVDAGALLKPALAEVGGKGGGSARIAQGTVPGPDALTALVERLLPR